MRYIPSFLNNLRYLQSLHHPFVLRHLFSILMNEYIPEFLHLTSLIIVQKVGPSISKNIFSITNIHLFSNCQVFINKEISN